MNNIAAHKDSQFKIANRLFRLTLLSLSVMAGITSCGKVDVLTPDDGWIDLNSDRPIVFSSSLASTETKTTDPTTLPDGTIFGVFAFYQQGVIGGEAGSWNQLNTKHWKPNFMYNEQVEFRIIDANTHTYTYTYSPIKYWPNNIENTITFWAYSPYSSNLNTTNLKFLETGTGGASEESAYSNTSESIPDIKYTVPDDAIDLLVSDLVSDLPKQTTNNTVSFSFHHTLSKINFKVKKAEGTGNQYTIKVKSLSFQNIYLTGIHGSNHWRDLSNQSSSVTPYVAYNGSGITAEDTTTPENPNYSIFLIPQNVGANNAILHVVYSVNDEIYEGEYTLTGSWLESTQYTYIISISPGSPITFTASISPWDETINGYYYIVN